MFAFAQYFTTLSGNKLITVRNQVAKVMFLLASVCPQYGGVSAPGGVCLLPGGVCSWGMSAPGGGIPACTEAGTPPGETATAADGTHPTGMHSCCF